jgi:hypothetical protein
MIRQPEVKTAAAMLRAAFAEEGVTLSHQKSLNLAARVNGFKNWAHAQATPADLPTAAPAATSDPSRESELAVALEWVSRNYVTTLSGKPVRDADECLSYASKLLGKQVTYGNSEPCTPPVPFEPCDVDWASVLACEDLTHLRVNGKERELCSIGRQAFEDQEKWLDFEYTDALYNRAVFTYVIPEALGQTKVIRLGELIRAKEIEPGVIALKDGRTLELLVEGETVWSTYSPAADELL